MAHLIGICRREYIDVPELGQPPRRYDDLRGPPKLRRSKWAQPISLAARDRLRLKSRRIHIKNKWVTGIFLSVAHFFMAHLIGICRRGYIVITKLDLPFLAARLTGFSISYLLAS